MADNAAVVLVFVCVCVSTDINIDPVALSIWVCLAHVLFFQSSGYI